MKRKRDCSSTDMPCPGSPEEEKDCNTQACAAPTTSVPVTATWNPARTDEPFVCQYFVGYFRFKNTSTTYCNLQARVILTILIIMIC